MQTVKCQHAFHGVKYLDGSGQVNAASKLHRLLVSLGWALFSIFPSYLMLHYSFLGHKGLRFACEASKLLMCITGLGVLLEFWNNESA